MSLTIERTFHSRKYSCRGQGRYRTECCANCSRGTFGGPVSEGRVPRISRLMALAIKFEDYVRNGLVQDYAELARLGRVSRARITQIMDLNLLDPGIQEAILNLPHTFRGRDSIRERHVRPISAELSWTRQRAMWNQVLEQTGHNQCGVISGTA